MAGVRNNMAARPVSITGSIPPERLFQANTTGLLAPSDVPFDTLEAPTIVRGGLDADSKPVYYLFYHGADGGEYKIGVATGNSLDSAFTPMSSDNPILTKGTSGAWDDGGVALVDVVFDPYSTPGTQWNLIYVGWQDGGAHANGARIGVARAGVPEGPYTKLGSNPVVTPPNFGAGKGGWAKGVTYHDGQYWMIFPDDLTNDLSNNLAMYTAPGPTGPWVRRGVVLTADTAGWESYGILPGGMVRLGDRFHAWYSGSVKGSGTGVWSAVGHAWSHDGFTWHKSGEPVILPTGEDDEARSAIVHPYPVIEGGQLRLVTYSIDRRTDPVTSAFRTYDGPYVHAWPQPVNNSVHGPIVDGYEITDTDAHDFHLNLDGMTDVGFQVHSTLGQTLTFELLADADAAYFKDDNSGQIMTTTIPNVARRYLVDEARTNFERLNKGSVRPTVLRLRAGSAPASGSVSVRLTGRRS